MGPLPSRPGAYRWWYLDALAPDGRAGLVVIFFCGSVFSPYYARRLRAGEAPRPAEHAAVHVALYRDGRRVAWLLAEHDGAIALSSDGRAVAIGRSRFRRAPDGALDIEIDDRAPLPMRGRVTVTPLAPPLAPAPLVLAPGVADHTWNPLVPRARVQARFDRPDFVLDAPGYHDENAGSEPLERALRGWTWARVHPRAGGTQVLYDVRARDGRRFCHVLSSDGPAALVCDPAAPAAAGGGRRSSWGIQLPSRLDAAAVAGAGGFSGAVAAMLESTPFYARYLVDGEGLRGVGETLDLNRFDQSLVRWMLRWRTWRRGRSPHPPA